MQRNRSRVRFDSIDSDQDRFTSPTYLPRAQHAPAAPPPGPFDRSTSAEEFPPRHASPQRQGRRNSPPEVRPPSQNLPTRPPQAHQSLGNDYRSSPAPPYSYNRSYSDSTFQSFQTSSPKLARHATGLEEGGVEAPKGTFANLFALYGVSLNKRALSEDYSSHGGATSRYMSRANSETSRWEYDHRRALSSDEPIDADDPIFTGAKPNRIDQDRRDQKDRERERSARFSAIDSDGREKKPQKRRAEKQRVIIQKNICSVLQRQNFVLKLAKALMTFGAPSHRIESQLAAAARILEIDAQFVHIPSVVIASFGDQESKGSDTHFVKAGGGLALGKLHKVHTIYRQVVHDEIGAEEGMQKLHNLLRAKPQYGIAIKCLLSFFCAALICPLAFGGSFIDMWIAGAAGAFLAFLQLRAATKSALYANVFEISVAIMVSFVARALSSIPSGIFCYNAISSAGVVLILPGYLILCSSLELASKNIVCGSVRMVYAIIYSLFLGFGLTIGSDLYLLIDSHARHRQAAATAGLAAVTILNGNFSSSNMTSPYGNFYGTFTFSNTTAVSSTESSIVTGCLRSTADPWWLRAFPGWTLFITVPMFSILSSLNNQQPLLSKQLPVMVVISCASFAANKAANHYIFNRSDVVSAIGAFVVGVLGNAYSRVFGGTAFTSMVTGVLFLVPSGLSAAGGLSDNYRSGDQDQFSNGLEIGMRMVQVGIGITVGLFGSGLFIYSFGSRKQAALFAF